MIYQLLLKQDESHIKTQFLKPFNHEFEYKSQ